MSQPKVVIAPDSFKGTIGTAEAATAIAAGWSSVRPEDSVHLIPQADGGEGTLTAITAAVAEARWCDAGAVPGPDGRPVPGQWVELGPDVAAVELALVCGLPLLARPDPVGASTHGLGVLLSAVTDTHPRRTLIALGGSASTDGGAGMLAGLGARVLDAFGRTLPPGGGALTQAARLDLSGLRRPPGELVVLADVTAPLLGPDGAAAVFGPQKGAGPAEVELLERGLRRWAEVIGVDPQQPGLGAAGGTAYALAAVLGAVVRPGAPFVAETTGLPAAIAGATVVITGEGRVDATSHTGKVVGHVLALPGPHQRIVIAGEIESVPSGCRAYSLRDLAGDRERAIADPQRWLAVAGALAATQLGEI